MGNKRKLLKQIEEVVDKIQSELGKNALTIGDGFSGSGIVSRMLKTKAKELYVNDIAGYSKTLNECYLANPTSQCMNKINHYIEDANKQLLNINNISDALKTINPNGIDVNSGIELFPGKKDKQKINNFFKKLKTIDEARSSKGLSLVKYNSIEKE